MAFASVTYTSASGTTFALTNSDGNAIPYIRQSDIKVYVNDVLQTLTTDYTFNSAGTAIVLNSAVSNAKVFLQRITSITDPTVVYTAGSTLTAQDLNNADNQIRYGLQEYQDSVQEGAGVPDGDKGEIVVAGNGTLWSIDTGAVIEGKIAAGAVTEGKIAAGAVTYAKIQDVSATDKLLGRSSAGSGDVEEITCTAAGRALLDDADASAQRTTLGVAIGTDVQAFDADTAKTDVAQSFTATQSSTERTITVSDFDLSTGNYWTCGAIAIPNPTNQTAGTAGLIRVTAAPTSFGSHFDFPGGSYTAPTSFPAIVPFFVQASGTILLGNFVEGIA